LICTVIELEGLQVDQDASRVLRGTSPMYLSILIDAMGHRRFELLVFVLTHVLRNTCSACDAFACHQSYIAS
jgi:hypothetical protein